MVGHDFFLENSSYWVHFGQGHDFELTMELSEKVQYSYNQAIKNGLYVWVIDQVRGQDGWILAKFFFCVFMDRDEVEVHKLAKNERGQYTAILTKQTWSIKDLLYGFR